MGARALQLTTLQLTILFVASFCVAVMRALLMAISILGVAASDKVCDSVNGECAANEVEEREMTESAASKLEALQRNDNEADLSSENKCQAKCTQEHIACT